MGESKRRRAGKGTNPRPLPAHAGQRKKVRLRPSQHRFIDPQVPHRRKPSGVSVLDQVGAGRDGQEQKHQPEHHQELRIARNPLKSARRKQRHQDALQGNQRQEDKGARREEAHRVTVHFRRDVGQRSCRAHGDDRINQRVPEIHHQGENHQQEDHGAALRRKDREAAHGQRGQNHVVEDVREERVPLDHGHKSDQHHRERDQNVFVVERSRHVVGKRRSVQVQGEINILVELVEGIEDPGRPQNSEHVGQSEGSLALRRHQVALDEATGKVAH